MATNWIKMECVPLPTANYPELLVYWNPDSGQLLGDQVDLLHDLVSQAMNQGINGAELSDPYRKPSELAIILSQFYILIHEPIAEVPHFVAASQLVQ